ncbi:hypothetical protein BDN72DRAFT_831765 [Pluteus cervinus]|uniref:Uncharacterized protein n=1 Tax=Pluteus cervinus TaxID=181527 RepID=A0ACD3BCD8_9AGAR|nr:hypothetical protein BDN72DRAFT_831765 [Pluteus cervinus]
MTPPALNNEDVIREILEYLFLDFEPAWVNVGSPAIKTSKSWLYNTAFLSRTFSQPALDLLWRMMDSLDPLLNLLPENVLRRDSDGCSVSYVPSVPHDLARFSYYAGKIQIFHYNAPSRVNSDHYGGWHILYALLHHPVVPSPLLPRLNTLHIGALALATNPSIPFCLLSPSLRRVNFVTLNGVSHNLFRTFISCLLSRAPGLQHFDVHDELPEDMTEMLFHFSQLRSLRLTTNNWATLLHRPGLARLPKLATLSVNLSALVAPAISENLVSSPNLTKVSIKCRMSVFLAFVNSFNLPTLSHLDLNFVKEHGFNQQPPHALFPDDVSILRVMEKWSSSLEILKINGGNIIQIDEIARSGNGQLSPVEFRQLTSLEIRNLRFSSFLSPLSDYTCWALARCLPSIQYLALPLSHSVSFNSLRRLVLVCPHLHSLQIGIDALSLSQLLFSPGPGHSYDSFWHNLQELSVGETIVHDQFLLARPLIGLFPNLKRIISPSKVWASVNDLYAFVRSLKSDSFQHQNVSPKDLHVLREKMIQNVYDLSLPDDLRLKALPPKPMPQMYAGTSKE